MLKPFQEKILKSKIHFVNLTQKEIQNLKAPKGKMFWPRLSAFSTLA